MKIQKKNLRKILWGLIGVCSVIAIFIGVLLIKDNTGFVQVDNKVREDVESQGDTADLVPATLEKEENVISNTDNSSDTETKDTTTETGLDSALATENSTNTDEADSTNTEVNGEGNTEVNSAVNSEVNSETSAEDNSDSVQLDIVTKMEVASTTDKIILVTLDEEEQGILSYYTKDSQQLWKLVFTTTADVGKYGITQNKKEGDKKTPSGCYGFTLAFGINENPGALLEYKQVLDTSYWVDDMESPYYNQWADSGSLGISFESEHLIDHNPAYLYALNIGYNLDCIPGEGSAIFMHCKNGKGYTTGCVGIDLDYMKLLVQQVDTNTKIVIAENQEEFLNY